MWKDGDGDGDEETVHAGWERRRGRWGERCLWETELAQRDCRALERLLPPICLDPLAEFICPPWKRDKIEYRSVEPYSFLSRLMHVDNWG